MIVAHHQHHTPQTMLSQARQKLPPRRRRLPLGQLHPQHRAPPLPVHSHRHQHCLAPHRPVLPHPLVTRIQHQVRIPLLQSPPRKPPQLLIQTPHQPRNRPRAELVPARAPPSPPSPCAWRPLRPHLEQRRHQRLLAALVPLDELRAKPPIPILRHTQLDLPYPPHQTPARVPRTVAQPRRLASHSHLPGEGLSQARDAAGLGYGF